MSRVLSSLGRRTIILVRCGRDSEWERFLRIVVLSLVLSASTISATVRACSLIPPPVAATAQEVAADGVLIRGRLIQAFDPDSEKPEIIAVDEIYVGSGNPAAYVIFRPKSEFERVRKHREPRKKGDGPLIACGPFFDHKIKVGEIFDRLVLMPAPSASDPAARGRWVFHFWDGHVTQGQGFDMLLEAAEQRERLRSRPRRKYASEGCLRCAPANR
jgi:hypothetical protein